MSSSYLDLLKEKFPESNLDPGGALYFLLFGPTNQIYTDIQADIEKALKESSLDTAENKDPLLANFSIQRKEGAYGVGELYLSMKSNLSLYIFPSGTLFQGGELISTEAVEFSTSATIPVRTTSKTEKVYLVGTPITSSAYPSLVQACYVSTQVSGGYAEEATSDWEERIQNTLEKTPTTEGGLRYFLKQEFPEVIDVKVSRTTRERIRRRGVEIDAYIKLPLEKVIPTSTTIDDIVIFSDLTPTSTLNRGTYTERNVFATIPTYYYRPYRFKEIQEWVNDNEVFPLGLDILLVQPNPYIVTGGNSAQYISLKSIGPLSLKQYIAETADVFDTFTIQDSYGGTTYDAEDIDDEYGGYYVC